MTESPILFSVRGIPAEAFGQGCGRHTRKLVLAMLASRADSNGSHCFPSIPTLSRDCALTERGAQKVISWLRQNGFLTIAYNAGPKQANVYTIVIPEVVNTVRGEPCSSRTEEHRGVNTKTKVVNGRSPNLPVPTRDLPKDVRQKTTHSLRRRLREARRSKPANVRLSTKPTPGARTKNAP